jgi:hypothetical protein
VGVSWPELSGRSVTVKNMEPRADHLLMLSGVSARCADCGDECVFVPVDAQAHEWCCTSCDAAVFMLPAVDPVLRRHASRVA